MPRHDGDPFAHVRGIDRFRLWMNLHRAWRRGVADRHAATLDVLQGVIGGDPVVSARPSRRGPGAVGEIVLTSGAELRLASCSRPHLAHLAEVARDHVVVLERAAFHGRCWGLYFDAGDEQVPLLADEVSVLAGGGFTTRQPVTV